MFRPSSHASPWNSCESEGSAMSSVALGPTTCAPVSDPLFASAANFTKPAVSPWMLALLRVDADPIPGLLGAFHLDADAAVDAGLLEGVQHLLRHVLVLERHEPVERLEQRDLDAELVEQRCELNSHRACSDDADRLG